MVLALLTACSVDKMSLLTHGIDGIDGIDGKDGVDGTSITSSTVQSEEGWYIYIYTDGDLTSTILIPYPSDGVDGADGQDGIDGQDGADGKDGIDGIDGIDGVNGVNVIVTTEVTESGIYLYIQTGDQIEVVFIPNGTDGIDGVDGIDGIDGNPGEDGISCTIRTEESEGGYYIIFLEDGEEVNRIFIYYAQDGEDGEDGEDGTNGTNGQDGDTIDIVYTDEGITITITHYDGSINIYYVYNGYNGVDGADGTNGTNGTNGTDGTDGTNGNNGYTSIIRMYQDGNCVVIISGLDLDGDMELDEDEITDTETLCDCTLEPNCCPSEDDPQKVALCHQRVIGNVPQYFTIYVPQSAVAAHIDHGDSLGECQD